MTQATQAEVIEKIEKAKAAYLSERTPKNLANLEDLVEAALDIRGDALTFSIIDATNKAKKVYTPRDYYAPAEIKKREERKKYRKFPNRQVFGYE